MVTKIGHYSPVETVYCKSGGETLAIYFNMEQDRQQGIRRSCGQGIRQRGGHGHPQRGQRGGRKFTAKCSRQA